MSSAIIDIHCPKCDYAAAILDCDNRSGEEDIFCHRCGYSAQDTRCIKEGGGNAIKTHRETGGDGSFVYKTDKMKFACSGPLDDETLEYMKTNLDTMVTAEYTFEKDGKWFDRDMVKNETTPYPEPKGDFWQQTSF
jgi:hypothetical protein